MFSHHIHANTAWNLPEAEYYAVGIAPDSEVDLVLVNGQRIGPGAPALLTGEKRSIQIEPVRIGAPNQGGTVALVAAHHPGVVGAVSAIQARASQPGVFIIPSSAAAGTFTQRLYRPGRRHHSFRVKLVSPGAITVDVECGRFGLTDESNVVLVDDRVVTTGVIDAFEIGGTDHEECIEWMDVEVSWTVSSSGGFLLVESYGELGR